MINKLFSFSKKYFFPILALSIIFVLPSIWWTTDTPYSQEDMAHIRLGFPLNFISQNHSQNDFSLFVQNHGVDFGSILEKGVVFFWHLFFLNIMIVQIVFTSTLFLLYSFVPRADHFFRFLSVKYILFALFLFLAVTIGPKFIPIGKEQMQRPEAGNSVIPPPPFANPVPAHLPAN